MNLLFDKSPREESPRKRGRKKASAALEEEPSISLPTTYHFRPTIGRVDDGVACVDSRCQAECHDITDTRREKKVIHWLLECCFCGTGQWIPAIDGRLDEPTKAPAAQTGEWRFPEGQRGAGCTVAAYFQESPDYVRWAATNEGNEEIRKACLTWLASFGGGR